jgi:hypothetical protein
VAHWWHCIIRIQIVNSMACSAHFLYHLTVVNLLAVFLKDNRPHTPPTRILPWKICSLLSTIQLFHHNVDTCLDSLEPLAVFYSPPLISRCRHPRQYLLAMQVHNLPANELCYSAIVYDAPLIYCSKRNLQPSTPNNCGPLEDTVATATPCICSTTMPAL